MLIVIKAVLKQKGMTVNGPCTLLTVILYFFFHCMHMQGLTYMDASCYTPVFKNTLCPGLKVFVDSS